MPRYLNSTLRLLVRGIAAGCFICLLTTRVPGQGLMRTECAFPDPPGLLTLRCDFHMHSVFSDGSVWPTVRVDEAWRDGLDVIALTDHIEYQPHKADVSTNRNRSYALARGRAEALGLLLLRGAEITRGEPPGHWNALFITNAEALNLKDYHDAVQAAINQGAFLFWNHPGWKQPDSKSVWYKEQGELYERGWLHGLEIVNGPEYDPLVHQWCLDRKLTPLGNSDIHDPIDFRYGATPPTRRPMTLVFAREKSAEAVKEALRAGRTAVYCTNALYGAETYLKPLFEGSVDLLNTKFRLEGTGRYSVQIRNRSAMDYELRLGEKPVEVKVPESLRLPAGKIVCLDVRGLSEKVSRRKSLNLAYTVDNLRVAPGQGLKVRFQLDIEFKATE